MLADLVRDVLMVAENRLADDVLEDFQEQEIQMAIVVDEWGSFEGLITAEDIFEESARSGTSSTRRSRKYGSWTTARTP